MAAVDPVSLGQRYKLQLQQTVDTLQEQVNNVKQTAQSTMNDVKAEIAKQQEQLQPILDGYKASIKDVETSVPPTAAPFLLKSYMWTAVSLFASDVGRVISGVFLYGVIGLIFDTWTAMLLTFVALPAFVFMNLRKVQMTEMQREQVVLLGAVAEGVLVGALFSNLYSTIFAPPIFLMPLSIGLLAFFAGSKDQVAGNRRVFLGALVGGAAVGYIVLGFILDFSFGYILSVAILSAAALVDLQLKVASFQRNDSSPQLEQWKTVVILTIAQSIARYLTSTTKQEEAAPVLPISNEAKN